MPAKYKGYRKLGRSTGERQALLRNLVSQLIIHESIQTTEARAKEARSLAEKAITLAKADSVNARRQAVRLVYNHAVDAQAKKEAYKQVRKSREYLNSQAFKEAQRDVVQKLFEEIGPRYKDRPGGYTRIVRLGPRKGDGAPIVLLQLV